MNRSLLHLLKLVIGRLITQSTCSRVCLTHPNSSIWIKEPPNSASINELVGLRRWIRSIVECRNLTEAQAPILNSLTSPRPTRDLVYLKAVMHIIFLWFSLVQLSRRIIRRRGLWFSLWRISKDSNGKSSIEESKRRPLRAFCLTMRETKRMRVQIKMELDIVQALVTMSFSPKDRLQCLDKAEKFHRWKD